MFNNKKREMPVISVSAGRLGGLFGLNRSDSGLVGLFGRDRSDPAAYINHYRKFLISLVKNRVEVKNIYNETL